MKNKAKLKHFIINEDLEKEFKQAYKKKGFSNFSEAVRVLMKEFIKKINDGKQ
jgi:metal-responsive CopG/Arc/MetJ family transcriptional regulator